MKVKIVFKKLIKDAKIPKRMTPASVGWDIFSANKTDICIPPNTSSVVPTGFSIQIPLGFEAQIRPRSGLAAKHQIGILNSPGTIDPDYRGEVKVILFNFGSEPFIVKPKMRIAQMVVCQYCDIAFLTANKLDSSQRSEGGFGHTLT